MVENTGGRVLLPETAPESKEIAKEVIAAFGKDALGMVLHGLEGAFAMPDAHDHAALFCGRSDGEIIRHGLDVGAQRVVPRGLDSLRDTFETAAGVMANAAQLAVHDFSSIAAY